MLKRFALAAPVVALSAFVMGAVVMGTMAMAQELRSPSPAGAKLYFIEPKNGAEITGPVVVKMGLVGMGVAPAGVEKNDTGHHHILVDQKDFDPMAPLPVDDKHRHFGGGQTETTLTLAPGTHTLQLILGNHNHIPHDPLVASDVITITVK
jgi:hypothetical protein